MYLGRIDIVLAEARPSAQPEEAEHEKYDDDGTNDPDNLVHDRCPFLARIG